MRWTWVAVSILAGTVGDLISAKGMVVHGEIRQFDGSTFREVLRYIVTNSLVVAGILFNAISFVSFVALLAVSDLSFAVPATALSYILKTALAHWYLQEYVSARRWTGAVLIALGVWLIAL
jgi:drug/metabolite transporter (DMT)-like permease